MAFIRIGTVGTQIANFVIINEDLDDLPANNKDGINKTFLTLYPSNSLQVFLNGQHMVPGVDFTVSLTNNREFTFTDPPLVSDAVRLNYIRI